MSLDQLTTLFQWMTILNAGILIASALLVMSLKGIVFRMHGRLFGITENEAAAITYAYLGIYRALFLVFSLVPYLALVLTR